MQNESGMILKLSEEERWMLHRLVYEYIDKYDEEELLVPQELTRIKEELADEDVGK